MRQTFGKRGEPEDVFQPGACSDPTSPWKLLPPCLIAHPPAYLPRARPGPSTCESPREWNRAVCAILGAQKVVLTPGQRTDGGKNARGLECQHQKLSEQCQKPGPTVCALVFVCASCLGEMQSYAFVLQHFLQCGITKMVSSCHYIWRKSFDFSLEALHIVLVGKNK